MKGQILNRPTWQIATLQWSKPELIAKSVKETEELIIHVETSKSQNQKGPHFSESSSSDSCVVHHRLTRYIADYTNFYRPYITL